MEEIIIKITEINEALVSYEEHNDEIKKIHRYVPSLSNSEDLENINNKISKHKNKNKKRPKELSMSTEEYSGSIPNLENLRWNEIFL